MASRPKNMAASVKARLLVHAKAAGSTFDQTLTRYVLERLLFRLSVSAHSDRFVLKGAMLLTSWFDDPLRPTRDIDFLGFGDPAPAAMRSVFADILATVVEEDGVAFDPDEIRIKAIREDVEYGGLRLKTVARIDNARVAVTIDIGFGDATTPEPELLNYPVLLDLPAPQLRAYARETVIAEKFQAMVALGLANTRIKDFYDIWVLQKHFVFDGTRLSAAIRATFDRRNTAIPAEPPEAFTASFAEDAGKQALWKSFTADLEAPTDLSVVVAALSDFLMPRARDARG